MIGIYVGALTGLMHYIELFQVRAGGRVEQQM